MKSILVIITLLLIGGTVSGQQTTNPERRLVTIKGDTMFVHLPLKEEVEYVIKKKRTITLNGKKYFYKVAYSDYSLFWIEQQKSRKKEVKVYQK